MVLLQVEPGGERYLSHARKCIRDMHEYMLRAGLHAFNKVVHATDGAKIYLSSVISGREFMDRIRITAAGGLILRVSKRMDAALTKIFRATGTTVSDVRTASTGSQWSKNFTTFLEQTTSTSVTLRRGEAEVLIEDVAAFDVGPRTGSYQDLHMLSADGKTALFLSRRCYQFTLVAADDDTEVLVRAVWNDETETFDVSRISLPTALTDARDAAPAERDVSLSTFGTSPGSPVLAAAAEFYFLHTFAGVGTQRVYTPAPIRTFWANRYTGTDVDMEYIFGHPVSAASRSVPPLPADTIVEFQLKQRRMVFSYSALTNEWTTRINTSLEWAFDFLDYIKWAAYFPASAIEPNGVAIIPDKPVTSRLGWVQSQFFRPRDYYAVLFSPDGARHEVTYPLLSEVTPSSSLSPSYGFTLYLGRTPAWDYTRADTASLLLDGQPWFTGVAWVSHTGSDSTGVIGEESFTVHALGEDGRGLIATPAASTTAVKWNWDGEGSIKTFSPETAWDVITLANFTASKSLDTLYYSAPTASALDGDRGPLRVWRDGELIYSSPAPNATTPSYYNANLAAFDREQFLVWKDVNIEVDFGEGPVFSSTRALHAASLNDEDPAGVSTGAAIPTSFTVEGDTIFNLHPVPAGFIGVI